MQRSGTLENPAKSTRRRTQQVSSLQFTPNFVSNNVDPASTLSLLLPGERSKTAVSPTNRNIYVHLARRLPLSTGGKRRVARNRARGARARRDFRATRDGARTDPVDGGARDNPRAGARQPFQAGGCRRGGSLHCMYIRHENMPIDGKTRVGLFVFACGPHESRQKTKNQPAGASSNFWRYLPNKYSKIQQLERLAQTIELPRKTSRNRPILRIDLCQ